MLQKLKAIYEIEEDSKKYVADSAKEAAKIIERAKEGAADLVDEALSKARKEAAKLQQKAIVSAEEEAALLRETALKEIKDIKARAAKNLPTAVDLIVERLMS